MRDNLYSLYIYSLLKNYCWWRTKPWIGMWIKYYLIYLFNVFINEIE